MTEPTNATPNEAKQARVDAALDKMRRIAAAEGLEMVRNADNTGWIFVGQQPCRMCEEIGSGFGPSHDGSSSCQSGSLASGGHRSHCTCDTCF